MPLAIDAQNLKKTYTRTLKEPGLLGAEGERAGAEEPEHRRLHDEDRAALLDEEPLRHPANSERLVGRVGDSARAERGELSGRDRLLDEAER